MAESKLLSVRHRAAACVLSRADVRALDAATIAAGISSIDLMERAGRAVTDVVTRLQPYAPTTLVLAGPGNNGGDGYVIARLLADIDWTVQVAQVGAAPKPGGDCAINAQRWRDAGGDIVTAERAVSELSARDCPYELVIDALFGTGLDRALDEGVCALVERLNSTAVPIIAVDVPSGLDADTGQRLGACVTADDTLTIGAAKPGMFTADGPDCCGRIEVVNIDLVAPASAAATPIGVVLDATTVRPLLPRLARNAHKGTRGHVLVAGGSAGKSGAVVMAARAALRAGAGLVTLAVPASIAGAVDAMMAEAMTLALPDDGDGRIGMDAWRAIVQSDLHFDVMAVGPGMGTGEGADAFLSDVLQYFGGPLVVDADAINLLAAGDRDLATRLARRRARGHAGVVLTPHPGEMARLIDSSPAAVKARRADVAREFSRAHDAVLVLKGAATVVAEAGALAFNTSGNPGMGTAGAGDVLAGALAATCVGVRPLFDAAAAAVYVHGLAGDLAAEAVGPVGYLAGEIADLLPDAFASLIPGSEASEFA